MSGEIMVCFGGNDDNNRAAIEAVKRLGNVNITMVGSTAILEGYVLLPYIEAEDEGRYYGLESINKFVEEKLRG